MKPLRSRRVWGGLFLVGVASLGCVATMAFFYFGRGPGWLDWWGGVSMAVVVIGFFGWLVTFDLYHARRRSPFKRPASGE